MVNVGPMEVVVVAALGLLGAAAAVALLVALFAAVAVAVTPGLAWVAAKARRWVWRDWHPPTDWLAGAETPVAPTPPSPDLPPVRAVSVVGDADAGSDVRLITGQALPGGDPRHGYASMTMVHAELQPGARLDLPAGRHPYVVVHVLAGRGRLGDRAHPARAGQFAVVEAGRSLTLAAGPAPHSAGLEVLVLGEVPDEAWTGPAVLDSVEELRRRLDALRRQGGRRHGGTGALAGAPEAGGADGDRSPVRLRQRIPRRRRSPRPGAVRRRSRLRMHGGHSRGAGPSRAG